VIKCHKNLLKQGVGQFALRSIILLILLEVGGVDHRTPTYKKGEKTDRSDYRDISLVSTTYKIVTNNLQSRLTPYTEEITGDHQCAFRRNRSTPDHTY